MLVLDEINLLSGMEGDLDGLFSANWGLYDVRFVQITNETNNILRVLIYSTPPLQLFLLTLNDTGRAEVFYW